MLAASGSNYLVLHRLPLYHKNMYFLKISLAKAVALAKPGQGQAVCGSFGLAHDFSGPKPLQAKPKPGLLGQAGPGKSLDRNPSSQRCVGPSSQLPHFHLPQMVFVEVSES